MVQRKVPDKLGIKPHHLKSDTQLVNLRPSSSSSQTHEKLKKIMKKSRPIKRSDESRSLTPLGKKKTQPLHKEQPCSTPATPQKQSPNYMKSTSSFEARKERSPKTPTPKCSKISKTNGSTLGVKGSRTSSLKMMRTLTKTPSFKPLRPSKKVILCEDLDSQRATCSSTLKESKFPNYLHLNPGGTELEGTSAMKVCPYTYCSLNGHHHGPVPPLKCFLSARRRALKTQKSFKLGCLSPHQIKSNVKKTDIREPVILAPEEVNMKEENRDFFTEIYSKHRENIVGQDLACCDIDWEEGYCSASCNDDEQTFKLQQVDGEVREDQIRKTAVERLYSELQELYDEESLSSGAWSEEDGDFDSDSSYQQMKINQDFLNYDGFEVSSTTTESDVIDKMDEVETLNLLIADENIKCTINYQQEETSQESKTIPDFAEKSKDVTEKNGTTIIYNIIQFYISVLVNGEKAEHSETDESVTGQVPATAVAANKMETDEVNEIMEEQGVNNEDDDSSEVNQMVADEGPPFNDRDIASNKQLNAIEKQDNTEQEFNECEACSQSNSMDVVTEMDEEPARRSDEDQTRGTDEITSEMDIRTISFSKNSASNKELPDPCINLRGLTRGKRPGQEIADDSRDFDPRGPYFLPEVTDPEAETVDLRHQNIDERKNAEEWMVDFALQQAVTTLAPARKRKVALLVEAFEKVMPTPIPKYENHDRHTSKAFTNARPMQACS